MKNLRCQYFTLLELAAVITIMILLTALAGVYISRDRKLPEFEQALRDFQLFCARARYYSTSDGIVRKIVFYPDENVFRIEGVQSWDAGGAAVRVEDIESGNMPYVVLEAIDPDQEQEDRLQAGVPEMPVHYGEWRFPEKLGVVIELPDMHGVQFNEENLELWRFDANGNARLSHALTVQINDYTRLITVSDFTGLVEIIKNPEDKGYTVW